jgi:hypothetical protein
MKWDRDRIISKLRELHGKGYSLAYTGLCKRHQALLSAACYHFGSYQRAVQAAGVDYASVVQRPRWSKQRIITLIKQARRSGEDLHWGAVTKRRDELARAAFAALQARLFGRWDRALHAAGLDADDVARYRTWDRNTVVFELKARAQDAEPVSSGALQKDDPGLHAAAIRYFEKFDDALRAARLDPGKHRLRRNWSREDVIRDLRHFASNGNHISDTAIRRQNSALYGAAVRLFGTFTAARKACGLKFHPAGPNHRSKPRRSSRSTKPARRR